MAEEPVLWEFQNSPRWSDGLDGFISRLEKSFSLKDRDLMEVRLIIEEMLVNITTHGNCRQVRLMAGPADGESMIEIQVMDDGIPFNPLNHPPADLEKPLEERQPGGMGIHLVRSLAGDMTYHRREPWNVVTLRKNLSDR